MLIQSNHTTEPILTHYRVFLVVPARRLPQYTMQEVMIAGTKVMGYREGEVVTRKLFLLYPGVIGRTLEITATKVS